jgi:hypothetical protein
LAEVVVIALLLLLLFFLRLFLLKCVSRNVFNASKMQVCAALDARKFRKETRQGHGICDFSQFCHAGKILPLSET